MNNGVTHARESEMLTARRAGRKTKQYKNLKISDNKENQPKIRQYVPAHEMKETDVRLSDDSVT